MVSFLHFFEYMPSWQKLIWISICLVLSWSLEGAFPLFNFTFNKWKHAGINLIFLVTSLLINLLFGILTIGIFHYLNMHHIGFLYTIDFPPIIELIMAILFLDFVAQYSVHYLLHKVSWMWRFHMIHHSDTKVDASTGTRHHPGDYVLRELFALLASVLLGAPFAFYIIYRILTIFFTYLTHANIKMPIVLDKMISLIFISPNMHKFHHHFERPWTDRNYGNIFSIWDRLFGTFVYKNPKHIIYGLDVLDGKLDEDIVYQLKIPFDKTIKTDY